MKAGKEISCPYCGKQSFLVKKSKLDGWKKIGEILVCSTCGSKIHDLSASINTEITEENNKGKNMLDAFASFLGTEIIERNILKEEEKKFCRDCKHYIKHPFFNKCAINNKEVNPMDDCDLFEKLIKEETDNKQQGVETEQ